MLSKTDLDDAVSGIGNHELDLISEKHEIGSRLSGVVDLHFLKALAAFSEGVESTSMILEQVSELGQEIDRALFNSLLRIGILP